MCKFNYISQIPQSATASIINPFGKLASIGAILQVSSLTITYLNIGEFSCFHLSLVPNPCQLQMAP